jgi:predicted cupin superfamily sugar epimerase
MNASEIISKLGLTKHPEGGYYKETYRCKEELPTDRGKRNVSTAIYFLLEGKDISKFHRIQSDECWFFHIGKALEIYILSDDGLKTIVLGNDISKGELPQAVIPARSWFGSKVKDEMGFAFVSCTVAPGFDFMDFEMADRRILLQEFPGQQEIITNFT